MSNSSYGHYLPAYSANDGVVEARELGSALEVRIGGQSGANGSSLGFAGGNGTPELIVRRAAPLDPLPPVHEGRKEIVFIESDVPELDKLLEGMGPRREVHVLEADRDGLREMVRLLTGRSGIDALHWITHGEPGVIDLGTVQLRTSPTPEQADLLSQIGGVLAPGGDILVYGCRTAADQGERLVEQLSVLTGADIAASSNPTGAADSGGDWSLEVRHGDVRTSVAVEPRLAALYSSVLDIANATVGFTDSSGNFVSHGNKTDASGDVSYKVNGDSNYVLVVDGQNQPTYHYTNYDYILLDAANNSLAGSGESATVFSFSAGNRFTATSMVVKNYAGIAQTLQFQGYDSAMSPVGSPVSLVLSTTKATSNTANFTEFTDISSLKVTSTSNGGFFKYLAVDTLSLTNIKGSDSTAPTLDSITLSDSALKIGDTATVTFTFSEAVTGFDNSDITVPNGSLSAVSSSDGGTTWTGTFTPTASVEDASNTISVDVSGVKDAASNAGSGTKSSSNFTIDTLRPTATLKISDTSLKVGDTATVTVTFSEAVLDLDNADLTTANGSLSSVSTSDGGLTWTATLTPTSDIEDSTNVITLDNTGVTDAAGNAGSGTTNSSNYKIDTKRPTATLSLSDTSLVTGETSQLTVTFSEAVSGFTNADLTIANGKLSSVSSSDGGTTWTATLTPTADVDDASNVITLDNAGIADAFGNAGTGTTDSDNYAIDTLAPSAPSTPDMTGGTDTGDSTTDNITGDTTPTFIGTGEIGATLYLYDTDGVTLLGSGTVNGSGKWSVTSSTLSHGVHSVTAKQTDASGNVSAASSGLSVSIVSATPSISSVAYNERSGVLSVSGSDFVALASGNDIDASQFTLTGEGGTYTLTDTSDVELTNSGSFSLTLSSTDQAAVQQLFNKNGTTSFTGASYKADGAEGWDAGVAGTLASTFSGKAVTVSGIATISSATYTAHGSGPIAAGTLTVTGTNLNTSADTVDPTLLTLQVLNGSTVVGTYTLTTAYNPAVVTVDSTSQFSIVLNATDQLFVNGLLNNAGTTSIDGYDYNLDAAAGWNTSFLFAPDGYVSTPALTNSVNVDDAASPAITSATFNTISQVLSVSGTDFVAYAGSANDVDTAALTITGAGGATYTLSSANVDVTSQTAFSVTLSNLDAAGVAPLLDKDGTKAADNTTYNLAAAINWNGQVATVADTTSALTVTTPAPTVTQVVQTSGDGTYKAGDIVTLKVSFDQAVVVDDSGGTPRILLETGTTDEYATYVSGSGSAELVFAYTVQSGDTSADLQYFDTASFDLNSGTIVSVANGTTADLALPGTGSASSLAGTSAVVIDTTGPSAPSAPDLDAGSDSGSSNSDDYTADDTPSFSGTAEADVTVRLYDSDGSTLLGSTTADGSGNWSITSSSLVDGVHDVTAKAADSVGNLSPASSALSVTIDSTAPTTTVSTLVFSSDTGVSATDFITQVAKQDISGTLSANLATGEGVQVSSDNGSTWIDASATVGNNSFVLGKQTLAGSDTLKVRVVDLAGNAGSALSQAYVIDTTAPAAPSAPDLDAGSDTGTSDTDDYTADDTPTFSGTADAGATVTLYDTDGSTVLGTATADGSGVWSLTAGTLAEGAHTLTAKATDPAGNEGAASAALAITVDSSGPTNTIATLAFSYDTGVSTTDFITRIGVQDVTGTLASALASDETVQVSLDNGGSWSDASASTGSTSFSLSKQSLTGSDTLQARVVDSAGGVGKAFTQAYVYDTTAPTATVSLDDSALIAGETATLTITFSEAVSGLTAADLLAANGVLSAPSSLDGGITWTAIFTPDSGVQDAANVITLDNTGVTDIAGNAGSASTDSANYSVDTQGQSATITLDDTALRIGDTATVTITFSEPVLGFSNADLTVANATLSSVSSADGGSTWTAVLSPDADIEAASNVITLDNSGLTDTAGNPGSGNTKSGNYSIDTRRPTATLALGDSALTSGETTTLTVSFSEAVNGFTSADLAAANGTLSAPSSADGGITWTATFTPDAGVQDATNVITLDNTGVADAAGNAGSGSTDSANYTVDTSSLSATIALDDSALRIGDSATVTITFSEAVLGFSNADLTVANATLSSVSSADGGITWTAILTPSSDTEAASNLIILDLAGVTDASSNAGSGSVSSANYAIDTRAPTATVVVADSALTSGETSAVDVVFSEVVVGFDNADVSVGNGSLSTFTSKDGGRSFSATFTPASQIEAPSNTIQLASAGITDAAGNPGSGSVSSNVFSIDTADLPSAPTDVAGTPGDGQIVVSWSPPLESGGHPIIDYTATVTPAMVKAAAGQCTSTAPATSCVISGLVNGSPYALSVTARTQAGSSSAGVAVATVTPFGPPAAPTDVAVVLSGRAATVSWTAPASTGGLPITSYTVTAEPGGYSCTATGNPPPTSCTIPDLPPGNYMFTVVATNAGGATGAGGGAGTGTGQAPAMIPVSSPWSLGWLGIVTALLGWAGLRRRERPDGEPR